MAIEKLERYEGYYEDESSKPLAPCVNGDYVLYSAARAREDALLEIVDAMVDEMMCVCKNSYWGVTPPCTSCKASAIIAEIERTR